MGVLLATECAKILLAGVCNSTLFSLKTGKLLLGRNRDFFQDAISAKSFPISPMDSAFFKHANLTQLCVRPPIQKILTCNRGFLTICRSVTIKHHSENIATAPKQLHEVVIEECAAVRIVLEIVWAC